MKGDFSRLTFDATKHYSRVLMQQGRVTLDADWNESVTILDESTRSLASDIFGPYGGPPSHCGFCVSAISESDTITPDFVIGSGRYYVGGVPCQSETNFSYTKQPDFNPPPLSDGAYLLYLDVWERIVTYLEDKTIREVALRGPDTAVRARIVWHVKAFRVESIPDPDELDRNWSSYVDRWDPTNRGRLQVRTLGSYTGFENRLYRFEIQASGTATENATFKWSRHNSSPGLAIKKISNLHPKQGDEVELVVEPSYEHRRVNWVEMIDSASAKEGKTGVMAKAISLDATAKKLRVIWPFSEPIDLYHVIRVWDHDKTPEQKLFGGALKVNSDWIEIEDGIQIKFDPGGTYRSGDYWLSPARSGVDGEQGVIEWRRDKNGPVALSPMGIHHKYAPIAFVEVRKGKTAVIQDCRWIVSASRRRTDGYKCSGSKESGQ